MKKNNTILLKNADFLIQDFSTIKKSSSVVIQGNIITDVGNADDFSKKYTFDEVYNCQGKIIMPGLVNTHTHCNETIMRGLGHHLKFHDWVDKIIFPIGRILESMEEEIWHDLAQLTAMELVASGTTSLVEHSVNYAKHHVLTTATALHDFGIRGAVAKSCDDYSNLDPGIVSSIKEEIKETRDFLEEWNKLDSDLIQAWVGPSGIEGKTTAGCTGKLLFELKQLANSYNTHFHIHLAGNLPEVKNIRKLKGFEGSISFANYLNILDEKTLLAHCIWIGEGEFQVLLDTGAKIAHCPSCNQICALGVMPLPRLKSRGIICGIGTDGTPQNDSLDMFRDMRQTLLLHKINTMDPDILDSKYIFKMATEHGAEILGIKNLGKIAPGYIADLITVNLKENLFLTPIYDPIETLIYAGSGGRDVAMTMVNGKVLYKDGEFKTVNLRNVISKVKEVSKRISQLF